MFSRSILLLLVVLLSGCTSAPELEKRDLPVPATWSSTGVDGVQAAKLHWRNFFPDPQLQGLIGSALENNRDLRIAAARVLEARAQYGVTRAELLPSIGLTGSGSFVTTPSSLLASGTSASSERYDLGASLLSFEVDFWGRLSGLSESARYSYLATEESQRSVKLSLIADVANAYFSLLQAQSMGEVARTTLELRQQSLSLISKGKEAGGAYELDYQLASGFVDRAKSDVDAMDYQLTVAKNRLNYLVGNSVSVLPDTGSLAAMGMDLTLAPGLPSDVLLLRPDVSAAEQRLRASHANIAAARAAFMPKVLLTATAGLASQGLSSLFSGAAWAFQPSIAFPLFDGGRLASSLELAEARKVISVAEYEKTIQQAFREVADLLSARQTVSRQLQAARSNRNSQGKLLEIANARYSVGLISYLDVLDAQREFIASQQAITQLNKAQLETVTQLYKALGGGSAE